MSKTVDERVVSMQFDNRNFESNVHTTMSTLDKLKQKLNLKDSAKSLEEVGTSAKRIDLGPLSNGVETVKAKFSALDVMAMTALSNITSRAMQAGENLIKAFTIDPVKSGFQEYELKMGSVQTIMASTGAELETVNKYLAELNEYSDKTIYSFSDMTNNIGKFTNAGVGLEDAVLAIKGISNEAAVSGANANEASRAMYNFSQALSAGYVKLIDWKSIENANMATVEFKDQLLETAVAVGTLTKSSEGYYTTVKGNQLTATQNFNDSLQDQWMTTEVLTQTLAKYADETTEIGKKAYASAQDVKTFSMMMDTLKEAAQSGWAESWELIIGDFDQAKSMWTKVSAIVGDIIGESSKNRNEVLRKALFGSESSWDTLIEKLNAAGISTEEFETKLTNTLRNAGVPIDSLIKKYGSLKEAIKHVTDAGKYIKETILAFANGEQVAKKETQDLTDKLEYFNNIVGKVINGDFGNGEERIKKMAEAGHDYAKVQKLVNEIWERNGHTWNDCTLSAEELAKWIGEMSVEEIKNAGYTEEQAAALKELAKQAEETGTPLDELIETMSKPTGRELLFESAANVFNTFKNILGGIKQAWDETFKFDKAAILYKVIEAIHSLTEYLYVNEEESKKITRTFKGLFAILDLIRMVVGGGLKVAFKLLTAILEAFDLDILDVTAAIGDVVVKFRDWIKENDYVTKGITKIAGFVKDAAIAFYDWAKNCEYLSKAYTTVKDFVKNSIQSFKDFVNGAKEAEDVPEYIIQGLLSGFKEGISSVAEGALELAKTIIETVKDFLGIHSPSKKFIEIGQFIIEGLVEGLQNGFSSLKEKAGEIAEGLSEFFSNIDWSSIFAIGVSGAMILLVKKVGDLLSMVFSPLEGLGDLMEDLGKAAKNIGKGIKFKAMASGMKDIAIALAILAASLIALTFVDPDKLWEALKILGVLSGILIAFGAAIAIFSKMANKTSDSVKILGKEVPKMNTTMLKLGAALIGMSIALLAMTAVVKLISMMKPEDVKQGFIGLSIMMGELTLFLIACGVFVKGKAAQNMDKISKMLRKLATTLLIMVAVCALAKFLSPEGMGKAALVAIGLGGLITGLTAASKLGGRKLDSVVKMITKVSITMLLLVGVCKLAESLTLPGMGKAALVAIGLGGLIVGLTAASKLAQKEGGGMDGVVKMITKVSVSLLLLMVVCKIGEKLDWMGMLKAGIVAAAFVGLVASLVAVTKKAGSDIGKVAASMIAFSISLGILAGICIILGLISLPALAKGITAIALLTACMSVMIIATGKAKEANKNIIALAVCIGVLTACVAVLSMIDPAKLAGATIALGSLMVIAALTIYVADKADTAMGKIWAMTAMVSAIGLVVALIANNPWEQTMAACAGLSLLMLSLSASMAIIANMKDFDMKKLASLGAMVLAVTALALVINALVKLKVDSIMGIVGPLALLAGTMAILAVGLNAMNGAIAGAAALLVVAAALTVLAPVLQVFANMSLGDIGKSLLMLAGIFAVFGVAGLLLAPITPIILALSAAIALFGAGCLSAGTGVLLFAQGLTILGQSGTAGVQVLIFAITQLILLIPLIAVTFIQGLVAMITALGQSAPVIAESVLQIVLSIIQVITETIPAVVEMFVVLLESILVTIAEHTPAIVQAGFDILIAIIAGIASNIDQVVYQGIMIVVGFIEGIAQGIPAMIQAAFDLIISFIDGLAQAIENNTQRMIESGNRLAFAIVDAMIAVFSNAPVMFKQIGSKIMNSGLVQGIKEKISNVKNTVKDAITKAKDTIKEKIDSFKNAGKDLIKGMINGIKDKAKELASSVKDSVKGAVDKVKDFLGIKSPSRLFKKFGQYVDEGFVIGVKDYANKVEAATVGIGESAVEGMGNALSQIDGAFDPNSPLMPDVTPVVDLSSIKKRDINLGTNLDASLTTPVNSLARMVADAQARIDESNGMVTSAINALREELSGYYENNDTEVALYVDSKKLASSLAKPMDRQLNILSRRGAY